MKKILTVITVVGAACAAFAQGNVNFANTSGSQNVSTNGTLNYLGQQVSAGGIGLVQGSAAAPSGFYYALLMKSWDGVSATTPASLTQLGGWTYTGVTGVNGLGLGRISGGSSAATTAGDVVGANNQFVVVGWTANLGTTWAQVSAALSGGTLAQNGFIGISSVGTGVGATSPPQNIFNSTGTITTPFTLYSTNVVPEPGTIALAGLGVAGLLAFRRKK